MIRRFGLTAGALCLATLAGVGAGAADADAGLHRQLDGEGPARSPVLPRDWPGDPLRTHRRLRRPRKRSRHVLRRDRHRGHLQDRQRRHHLHAGLRQRRLGIDRRDRDRAHRRQSGVGGHGRGQQPPELVVGRRRLQVDRRRPHLEEHGPQGQQADREDRRRSDGLQRRLRRGARGSVGRRRRARRLQDHRRRQHLAARPSRRRRHGRDRTADGSQQQQDAVCGDVSAAARAVGHERRRAGQRDLEVDRRRPDLDQARTAASRRVREAAPASTSIAAIRTSCTRASSIRPTAASTAPTMAARAGGS